MDPALRALKFAKIPGITIADACTRYGITRGQFQRARKKHGAEITWTIEDVLLGALAEETSPVSARDLVEYVDALDHSGYDARDLEKMFVALARRGLVERRDGGWVLCAMWP